MPEYHPDYIHHQDANTSSAIREIVFGIEDGMISTLGAITGIAAGTGYHFTVVLSGFVIIGVESIAMGVGSFLSSKSKLEVQEQKIAEEKVEIMKYPEEEKHELYDMYVESGWPKELAKQMATAARHNRDLFLQEMALHELKVIPDRLENPAQNGLYMGFSYIVGGAVPLLPYLLGEDLQASLFFSVGITLIGLFALGVATTKFTKRVWWRAGLEMLFSASTAAFVGYLIGHAAKLWWEI